MGFFDKVKGMANKITGGGAKVTLSFEGDKLGEPVKVTVTAVLKDAPMDITKVYLRVKSIEKINIPKNDMPVTYNDRGVNVEKDVYARQEFEVSGAQKLEGGQTYTWTYDLTINDWIPHVLK